MTKLTKKRLIDQEEEIEVTTRAEDIIHVAIIVVVITLEEVITRVATTLASTVRVVTIHVSTDQDVTTHALADTTQDHFLHEEASLFVTLQMLVDTFSELGAEDQSEFKIAPSTDVTIVLDTVRAEVVSELTDNF